LRNFSGEQLLITEGDKRNQDPLGLSVQFDKGFSFWIKMFFDSSIFSKDSRFSASTSTLNQWKATDSKATKWLDDNILLKGKNNEPALARWLPQLVPEDIPIMFAASTPIRDCVSFSDSSLFSRICYGFRGASGIDGTLSLALGLSIILGPTLLITGDLAFLHDSNGLSFAQSIKTPLLILLIDNAGGGIFKQRGIETIHESDFKNLFAMPQLVDMKALSNSYGIPFRDISCLEELDEGITWGLSLNGPVVLRVTTNANSDVEFRKFLFHGMSKQNCE